MSQQSRDMYADESVLVTHLLDRLEARLAGRCHTRVLRTIPSDHCHLGVLGPRDVNVDDIEELDVDDDSTVVQNTEPDGSNVAVSDAVEADGTATEDEEATVSDAAEAEQREAEQRGHTRDSTRRPPSSLGFEIVAAPDDATRHIDLAIHARFAIYTQHFPTFDEEREEIGTRQASEASGEATAQAQPQGRDRVTLIEAFERHVVEVPPIQVRIDTLRGSRRLDDNGAVQAALDAALSAAVEAPDIWRGLSGDAIVPIEALHSAHDFAAYLGRIATGPIRRPPLRAGLAIRVHPQGERAVRIQVYLCNYTPRDAVERYRDQYHILADACVSGTLTAGHLRPVELLPVPRNYQFDRSVWAVGHGASVVVSQDRRSILTEALARYRQPRLATNHEPHAAFDDLIEHPFETLEAIRCAMINAATDWQERVINRNEYERDPAELEQCTRDLAAFRDEEARFSSGIAALAADERLLRAFKGMNRVIARTSAGRFDIWHLFQIVFIVTQLPALAIREDIASGEWPRGTARSWTDVLDWGDVLWFQTGGGKTEAYLGLISCAALYDRLRGKTFGVTAWLRFPLRMLSVQQLQRAVAVVWQTEQERLAMQGNDNEASEQISLGYLVGKSSTPNTFRDEWAFEQIESDPRRRDKLLLISNCPACNGVGTVGIELDRTLQRVRHRCRACQTELPVFVSDDEVYRFLPTVVIGTIDKMASVAYNPRLSMLWGGASWKCPEHPEHGFGIGDWCIAGCQLNPQGGRARARQRVCPYDGTPTLHIQDELHLLQQELGAFAGHYETLIRACEERVGGRPPKTVAATATIEGFEHQIRQIYGIRNARRFPTRGYDLLDTFYTSVDRDSDRADEPPKTARIYAAFQPPHLHAADAASLCARYLHEELIRLYDNPYEAGAWLPCARTEEEVRDLLYFYATTLTYVGSKARGVRIRQALDRDASRLRPAESRDLTTEFLSGDSSLAEIADTVRRLENPPDWAAEDYLDATVATSVISHGVDVERFNLMVMDGIPEETADYIQASSRAGRRHVGLVLTVLPSYSLRASSIYHRFKEFHAHLERLVSPVSVNRFAKYAAERTASGVLTGLLLGQYCALAHTDSLRQRNRAVELLSPGVPSSLPLQVSRDDLEAAMERAYALGLGVYAEGLEAAMRETLQQQLERFIYRLRGSQQRFIWDVVQPRPMTSLRDVDVGVRFRPSDDASWQDLQWFNSQLP